MLESSTAVQVMISNQKPTRNQRGGLLGPSISHT